MPYRGERFHQCIRRVGAFGLTSRIVSIRVSPEWVDRNSLYHMHKTRTQYTWALGPASVSAPVRRALAGVLGAAVFAALTTVGAMIQIPLHPVPITLQTMFVVLGGAVLGARYGLLGQSFYITAGAVGMPVFAGSLAGLAIVAGPTGGYLLGFLVAPIIVGRLISRSSALWYQLLVFALGSQAILVLGVLHLAAFHTGSISNAILVGYLPFLLGDALKTAAGVSIYRSWRALRATRQTR